MSNSRILSPKWIHFSRVIRHTRPDDEDGYLVMGSEISSEWKFREKYYNIVSIGRSKARFDVRTFPEWVTHLSFVRIKRKAISWWVASG